MTGIIVSSPPSVELPPGNNANNPQGLPGVTYSYALLTIPQTWGAKQTFPLGTISVNWGDVTGAPTFASLNAIATWSAKQTFPLGTISVNWGDVTGATSANNTWTGTQTFSNSITDTAAGNGSASAFIASSSNPSFAWNLTSGAVDSKNWDVSAGATTLTFRAVNDASSSGTPYMTASRTGNVINSVSFPNGFLAGNGTNPATYPAGGTGYAFGSNFSNAEHEVDAWNTYTTTLPTKSFRWKQQTGAGAALDLMALIPPGSGTSGTNNNPGLTLINGGFSSNYVQAGTTANSISSNYMVVSPDTADAGGGFSDALDVVQYWGGGATKGGRQAVYGLLDQSGGPSNVANTNHNYVAGAFQCIARSGDNGTNVGAGAQGGFFGINPVVRATGGTNYLELAGGEVDTFIDSAAVTVKYLVGWSVCGFNKARGTVVDAAYTIGGSTGHLGWTQGICFTDFNGANPVFSGSTLFGAVLSAPAAVTNGIKFNGNFTFSGNAYDSPGFAVDGSGNTTAKTFVAGSAPTAAPAISVSANSFVTIANGANALLSAGAGLILIRDANNNHQGLYLVGVGIGNLVSAVGATFVAPTSTPAAGQVSIAYDGAAAAYRIYNNFGASHTFVVCAVNTGGV